MYRPKNLKPAFITKPIFNMKLSKMTICLGIALCCYSATEAQGFLKKIKEKAENATNKVLNKKGEDAVAEKTGIPTDSDNSSSSSGTGRRNNPSNKGGGGLISTPPDVKENLGTAETAFKGSSYSEARYAIQQAMLGVELEIGQKILKSLPATIANLPKDTTMDEVTSTGWGWEGLRIVRVYAEKDKQLTFTVSNNAMWMQAVNLYLSNNSYAQSTGGQQNWKQIKVKGNRAVIEYNDRTGYKVSVPIGQTSVFIYEGVNFATEQDMMAAVNQIDIDSIKAMLGEK
jgi:hypothetical protein